MGIPSFYWWLVGKYPSVVSGAGEAPPAVNRGSKESPDDGSSRYDNLYLDMNCIIHAYFHPQDQPFNYGAPPMRPPTTFDEVFQSMFGYMDDLFRIVKPRRLLYLAVDGVAPCSKMIGIRSGRFHYTRNAKAKEIKEEAMHFSIQHGPEGNDIPPPTSEVSDPNIITPGTEFMEKLSQALEYYIRTRLNCDPGWKDIMVILSDANVPGEGEHKIMSFIRAQRCRENYDPNTRHCVYGNDADLIMLALASHEVHFSILRQGLLRRNHAENFIPVPPQLTETNLGGKLPKIPHLFLNIWVLREYLELELKILDPVCQLDFERLIDDFIFICFLMGNDFIPHIPSLDAHEFAADLLIEVYKTTFNKMGGYITNTEKVKDTPAAYLDVSRLEMFFHALSISEDKIFLKRYELEYKLQRKILREALESERRDRNSGNMDDAHASPDTMGISSSAHCHVSTSGLTEPDITNSTSKLRKEIQDTLRDFDEACHRHKTRLELSGWKSCFYGKQFSFEIFNEGGKLLNEMAQKYLEGLCWMLQCYFADIPSWTWYYPFYKAPPASDLKDLSPFKISFIEGKPLRPFNQLMAVLPPESLSALPKCYGRLMSCEDSAIGTFYPKFVDLLEGNRFSWHGIAEPPVIDEELLSTTKAVEKELTMHEMRRNTVQQEKIFIRKSNGLANNEAFLQTSGSPQKLLIDSAISGIGGWVLRGDKNDLRNGLFRSPIKTLPDITYDQAKSATFFNPETKPIPALLGGVRVPDKTVREADVPKRPLWHTYPGYKPPRTVQRRPDTIWKPSSPSTPREEHKYAGTGWMGRGRGNVIGNPAETPQIRRSSYGHGVGNFDTAEKQQSSSDIVYRRGFRGVDMAQSRRGRGFDNDDAYSFRPHGGAWIGSSSSAGTHGHSSSAAKKEHMAWRPGGSCERGSLRGNGGASRGIDGPPRPRGW